MAGDVDLTLDIRGRNSDALRAIAGTKAAMRGIRGEQRSLIAQTRDQARYNRELNKALDRQRVHLRALTGDYIALRRALYTLGIRAAITGFSALSSAAVSLGADVAKLTREVGFLGVAVGQTGLAMGQGFAQGAIVAKLALKDVDKALTSSGKDRQKAMDKLTAEGRNLVRELEPLRKAYKEVQLLSQKGLTPGLARSADKSKKLIDEVRDGVWNTARAMGYLADHATTRLVRKQADLRTALRLNIVSGRRAGDSIISLGEAYLTAYSGAETFINFTTKEIVQWSRQQRRSIERARANGDLADFYLDAEQAWRIWTSTLGATGGAVVGFFKASEESSERMARNINEAAKSAERWIRSEKGQKKIKDGLEELEPVSGEIAKAVGATAKAFVAIGIEGADSAERILRGYRTQVLPLLEEMAIHLDEGMLQSLIDLTRESVEFAETAMPAFQGISDALAEIVEMGADVLSFINDTTNRMPALNQAVAGLAIGAGILVGWGRLKQLMELVLLRGRQLVGLAPRITPALAGATGGAAGGMSVVGSAGRSAGTRQGVTGAVGSGRATGMRTAPNGGTFMMPMSPRSGARGTVPRYGRDGKIIGATPLPRSITQSRQYVPQMFPTSAQAPVFFQGQRVLGRIQDYDPKLTKGDPLTGGKTPGAGTGKNAGRMQWVGALASNSARGAAEGVKSGISRGVREASPVLKGGLKIGVAGAVLGGIMGALSSGELQSTFSNRIGRMASGFTFGAIQSPDDKANDFMASVQRAMASKGTVRLDPRSDEQRAFFGGDNAHQIGQDSKGFPALSMAKPEDIARLKEWADVSERAGKLSLDQAKALREAADAQLSYINRTKEATEATKTLKGTTINESDLKPGIESLGLLEDRFKELRRNAKPHLSDVQDFTRDAMRNIKTFMVKGSLGAKQAVSSAFMESARAIKKGMREGTISAEAGAKKLNTIFRRNLAQWGYSGKEINNYLKSSTGDMAGKHMDAPGKAGPKPGAAKGGFFVGNRGERGADNVRANLNGIDAVVARGEYVGVFNGEQQAALDGMARAHGYGGMRGFFEQHNTPHSRTRRFAQGGIVPIPGQPGESINSAILGDVLRLKRRYKLNITDGYATSGHAANGEHPKGLAIDAVPGEGGSWDLIDQLARWAEPSQNNPRYPFRWVGYDGDANHGRFNHIHLSWLANAVMGGAMGAPEKLKRVVASGSMPPAARAMVQGGLDMLRSAGNNKLKGAINALGGTGGEPGEMGSGGGYTGDLNRLFPKHFLDTAQGMAQLTSAQVIGLAKKVGLPGGMFDKIAMGESQRYPGIVQRDPGDGMVGWGLWQMTPNAWGEGAAMQYLRSLGGIAQMLNPWKNAKMAKFLYEHAGSKTPNTPGFPWYGTKFLASGALFGPKPPPSDSDAPKVNIKDAVPPGSKADPKKKGKGKTPPVYAGKYPSGVANAIQGSKALLSKGKRGKIKPYKIRKKVKKLVNQLKDGRWFNDPDFIDPLTGQAIDPEMFPMFNAIRALRNGMPGLQQALQNMQTTHGLTDEYATLGLEGDDLRAWLASQGMSSQQIDAWIATYGSSTEIGNAHGFSVRGSFMRGLDQFSAEVGDEMSVLSLIRGNWENQGAKAKGVGVSKGIAFRRERLREIRAIFRSNRKVIARTKKKMNKMKGKGYSWKSQIQDNDSIIDALQDHARNSRHLPEAYRDRIYDDIDSLQDLNKTLRDKKPKNMPLGHTHLAKLLGQRQRENALIAGGEGVTDWITAVQGGGIAGKAAESLSMWEGARDYKKAVIDEATQGYFDADSEMAALRKSLDDFKTSMWVPPPEAINDGSGSARDQILADIGLNTLRQQRLGQFESSELTRFAQLLGMRSLGAFSHGIVRVPETGLALLHKNETVVPDQNGPFRNGMTMNRLTEGGGGDVYLIAEGDLAAFFKMIGLQVRRATGGVSADQGRMTRALRAAPGR